MNAQIKEQEKFQINNSNSTPQETKKRRTNWAQSQQKKGEQNEIENRKTIEDINKTKSCFIEKMNKIDKLKTNEGEK